MGSGFNTSASCFVELQKSAPTNFEETSEYLFWDQTFRPTFRPDPPSGYIEKVLAKIDTDETLGDSQLKIAVVMNCDRFSQESENQLLGRFVTFTVHPIREY
jgi:hypothetical protein